MLGGWGRYAGGVYAGPVLLTPAARYCAGESMHTHVCLVHVAPMLQVSGPSLLAGAQWWRLAECARPRGAQQANSKQLEWHSLHTAEASTACAVGIACLLRPLHVLADSLPAHFTSSCPFSPLQFSPQPSLNRPSGPNSRLHSPGGYPGVAYGDGNSLRGSPFVGADPHSQLGAAAGHLGQPSLGIPYSPDGSLAYSLGGSGPASLEPSAAAAAAAAQLAGGASGGQPQQASLLAQLQQIWGEGSGGGGGAAGGTPAFGASLGASPAAALLASEAAAAAQQQQQQQQQLATLLFMQHLEMQQAALAARGLTPSRGGVPDSPPLSPQQLPPASADMLRDVLGSPLSPLRWSGNHSARGGTGDLLTNPSLSLGAELAAAAAMALREMEETGEELSAAQRGRPAAARSLADGGGVAQQGSGQPQRQLVSPSPERPSFESMDLDALGFTESLD